MSAENGAPRRRRQWWAAAVPVLAGGAAIWWSASPPRTVWLRRDYAVERTLDWSSRYITRQVDASSRIPVFEVGPFSAHPQLMRVPAQPANPATSPPEIAVSPPGALTVCVGGPDGRPLPPITVAGVSPDGRTLYVLDEPSPLREF